MKLLLSVTVAALFVLPAPAISEATASSPDIGEKIENPTLTALSGGKQKLIGKAAVNVLVFFRPEHEYSKLGLEQIAKSEKDLAGKSVRWVALVSSRYSVAQAKAMVEATGIQMPVLIDKDDGVYSGLALALHPMVVLIDKDGAVRAYQPFRKVNFHDAVTAQVRRQLGEISDEQLAAVIHPAAVGNSGAQKEAMRRIKLGRAMLKAGKYDKALDAADTAIAKAPDLAAGHTLRGLVLAARDMCDEAVVSFARALELDPEDSAAREGKAACGKASPK